MFIGIQKGESSAIEKYIELLLGEMEFPFDYSIEAINEYKEDVKLAAKRSGDVNIDATNFHDAKFCNYMSTQLDENADGTLGMVRLAVQWR